MVSAAQSHTQLNEFLQSSTGSIIDLRDEKQFALAHLLAASHFPATKLQQQMYRLPAKGEKLKLIGSLSELAEGSEWLAQKGYQISGQLIWNDEVYSQLLDRDLIQTGNVSLILWKPAPIVERFIREYAPKQKNLRALDIACGAGRDAVFLALASWQVVAVDYLSGAIGKVRQLAEQHQVEVSTLVLDLEQSSEALMQIEGQFDLILVVRYLHRPLFQQIKHKLNPGGFLVYQTFSEGCELFGKPKNPRFILGTDELAREFASFTILYDQVELLSDGRPTKVFIAQKR